MNIDLQRRWAEHAACRGMPPDVFFYDTGVKYSVQPSHLAVKAWAKAKAICETCPVLQECARDTVGEPDGVWGGMDPIERHRARAAIAVKIRKLPREEKLEWALTARSLTGRSTLTQDTARRMGVTVGTVGYLADWLKEYEALPVAVPLKEETEELASREVARDLVARRRSGATLNEIVGATGVTLHRVRMVLHQADPELLSLRGGTGPFPERAPDHGDGWVRYDGTFVDAVYMGQTEDDEWFQMRMNLYQGNSTGWFRKRDVSLCRNVVRTVTNRLNTNGSRIHATSTNGHLKRQAG